MKKILLSFSLFASSFIGFTQDSNPCATTFSVGNNGGGNCSAKFEGNVLQPANNYSRSGVVEIRFASAIAAGVTPVITEIRSVTTVNGQPVVSANPIEMRFSLKEFTNTARTEADFCFYSPNGENLTNGGGVRYEVTVGYLGGGSVLNTCLIIEQPDPITLPVSFGTFAAERKSASSVHLKWNTLSEQNNKGFYVQRNTGNGWKDAGFVFSLTEDGYSSANLSYEFKDVNLEKGITQYRILQVDRNGSGRYSDTRSVRGEGVESKIVIYPNPSNNGKVNVLFESNSSRDISINDLSGRVVKQMANYTDNSLTVDNLPAGFYSLRVTDKATNTTVVEKIIINKR
jgi:hypothetical protein